MRLYGRGLLDADQEVCVRFGDGRRLPLAIGRYLAAADTVDRALLSGVRGPVLDVGCGPGRHLHALAGRGVFALGVDLSPVAVDLARGRGGRAIVGDVFEELPGAGTWRTALLLDGNIGIGGEPERLLRRLHLLVATDGQVIVELAAPGSFSGRVRARLESRQDVSSWFAWAQVTPDQLGDVAAASGFSVNVVSRLGTRWFARLSRLPAD
jgi:SAM-dependent methyltransferase